MDYSAQLDLDLSALEVDDFEVVDEEFTIESLTAGHASNKACHYCACPCICVVH
jgi:hypothetical protein